MGETFASPLPAIVVLLPVSAALLVLVTGERNRNLRDSWSTIAAVCWDIVPIR